MKQLQLQARNRFLLAKYDPVSDKQATKHFQKNINKYERQLQKRLVKDEYQDFVNREEEENEYLNELFHGDDFDEYYAWCYIDLDNLPDGVTFQ